jgi:hypothetical protein
MYVCGALPAHLRTASTPSQSIDSKRLRDALQAVEDIQDADSATWLQDPLDTPATGADWLVHQAHVYTIQVCHVTQASPNK